MELTIPKAELQRALARIQAVVEKRNSMPILANTLLTASKEKGGRLEVAATDLEVGIRGLHEAKVRKAGALTVGARKLFEIVRELPDEDVVLKATPNSYLEVRCSRSRFTLAGTTGEEYPTLPELAPARMAHLQAAVLSTMIERTAYAASSDETRYNLNGVYLEVLPEAGKLRMVATDGHRLAYVDRNVGEESQSLQSGVILPRKALSQLRQLVDEEDADEIEIGFEGSSALVRKGEITLSMRLIEGEFPNYQQVLPKEISVRVIIEAERLERALRRVALLSAERSRAVRVELGPNRLLVSSSNPDLGEAQDELDLDYTGEEFSIGFNARYMLDALAAFHAKEVEFALSGGLAPATLRPTDDPDVLAVVMPMRL